MEAKVLSNAHDLTLDWWFTFENRISRFDKKLRIAQYAEHSIYDYKLKIAQAVLYLQKLPDDFTQDDVEERDMQDQMGGYLLRTKGPRKTIYWVS